MYEQHQYPKSTHARTQAYVFVFVDEPRLKGTVENGSGNAGKQAAEHENVEVVEMLLIHRKYVYL